MTAVHRPCCTAADGRVEHPRRFLALLGNSFLTVCKLVAFLLSGSGAMLSEAIHSFADTGNQGLLYLGIRRSTRDPGLLTTIVLFMHLQRSQLADERAA